MIDLHCHILPGIDDGATDLGMALAMARAFVSDGVQVVACTPHILPGVYHNTGPSIRQHVAALQAALVEADIPLRVVPGADNHVIPDFVEGLRKGHLLSLADTRYVLVEPPHHVAPARLDEFFFNILVSGYVPILTHPERLTWIHSNYTVIKRLAEAGVWMQVTSGSLTGAFGRDARYWAERLLDDQHVHILATDAHDLRRRPPDLARGFERVAARVGELEATHLVVTRPMGILANQLPAELPCPVGRVRSEIHQRQRLPERALSSGHRAGGSFAGRLRRLFE